MERTSPVYHTGRVRSLFVNGTTHDPSTTALQRVGLRVPGSSLPGNKPAGMAYSMPPGISSHSCASSSRMQSRASVAHTSNTSTVPHRLPQSFASASSFHLSRRRCSPIASDDSRRPYDYTLIIHPALCLPIHLQPARPFNNCNIATRIKL